MSEYFACRYVSESCPCLVPIDVRRGRQIPPRTEIADGVTHYVGAGYQTQFSGRAIALAPTCTLLVLHL